MPRVLQLIKSENSREPHRPLLKLWRVLPYPQSTPHAPNRHPLHLGRNELSVLNVRWHWSVRPPSSATCWSIGESNRMNAVCARGDSARSITFRVTRCCTQGRDPIRAFCARRDSEWGITFSNMRGAHMECNWVKNGDGLESVSIALYITSPAFFITGPKWHPIRNKAKFAKLSKFSMSPKITVFCENLGGAGNFFPLGVLGA